MLDRSAHLPNHHLGQVRGHLLSPEACPLAHRSPDPLVAPYLYTYVSPVLEANTNSHRPTRRVVRSIHVAACYISRLSNTDCRNASSLLTDSRFRSLQV